MIARARVETMPARVAIALLVAVACSQSARPHEPPRSARDAEIEHRADELVAQATRNEAEASQLLQAIAKRVGGSLAGFESRLKTRASTVRKIRTTLLNHPDRSIAKVDLGDSLRYTLVVDDDPAGRHADAIRATFAALTELGHTVKKVKNYWPCCDNYSGVNTVIVTPDGLSWELQFHTQASYRIKAADHELYEQLRADDTKIEVKRELFNKLAAPWKAVPIPKDMLVPHALHATEEIILIPPP
jgi:hypothetical protein